MTGGRAKLAEPAEIRAVHGAFAVHVGAQERRAKGFEVGHDLLSSKLHRAPPAEGDDTAFLSVKSDYDSLGSQFLAKRAKEVSVDLAVAKRGAADDDLIGAELGEMQGPGNAANATADAEFHGALSPR